MSVTPVANAAVGRTASAHEGDIDVEELERTVLRILAAAKSIECPGLKLAYHQGWKAGNYGRHEDIISSTENALLLDQMDKQAQDLDEAIGALTKMRNSYRLAISSRVGFAKLPDEIVLNIVSYNTTPTNVCLDYRAHLRMMTTLCIRFRNLIHAHASFWTNLSNHLNPLEVMIYLQRSKAARLSIQLCPRGSCLSCDSGMFLSMVVPHCHRWSTLNIDYVTFDKARQWLRSTVEDMFQRLKGLHLPALEELRIQLSAFDGLNRVMDWQLHPYTTWQSPVLRVFTGHDMIPSGNTTFKLTYCCLSFYSRFWRCPENPLAKMMAFFESQPTLEGLKVLLGRFPAENPLPVGKPVCMPALQDLYLEVDFFEDRGQHVTGPVVPFISKSLAVPALKKLSLDFPINDEAFRLQDVFPPFNNYTETRELELTVFCEDADADVHLAPFEVIFERMSNLEHLSIGTRDLEVLDTIPMGTIPPPLRTLRIHNSPGMKADALFRVLKNLSGGPHWDRFEKLTVSFCDQLDDCGEALLDYLPPEKFDIRKSPGNWG